MSHRKIKNVMTTDVTTVRQDTPFKDIVRIMDQRGVSAVPVLGSDDRVIGVVSQADLLAKQKAQDPFPSRSLRARLRRYLATDRVRAIDAGGAMSTPAYTIGPDATVVDAAKLLDSKGIKRLPVVDENGGLVGIVSRRDLLSVFLRTDEDIAREIRREVFARDLGTVANPATVTVTVHDGVVTLHGELERKSMIPLAESLTGRVDGVVSVDAELTFAHDDIHPAVSEPPVLNVTHDAWRSR